MSLSVEEEARRQQAEREQCAAQEQVRMLKSLQEDQNRTHQQHIDQLKEKMEVDMRNSSAEYQRVLDAKLKVRHTRMYTQSVYTGGRKQTLCSIDLCRPSGMYDTKNAWRRTLVGTKL